MIYKWFLKHQWKEMQRSSIWQKNIALNIVLGFLILLMLLYLLMLGLFIDKILTELYPDDDPVSIFNGVLIYYLGFEFFIRFFMQNLPTLNVEAYLHLPVRKSSIVHYVAVKSVFAIGNYLSWLVIFPFAFKVIAPAYSTGTAWIYILALVMLVFTNNFLATYIKRQLVGNAVIVGVFGMILVSFVLLDYFQVISVSQFSAAAFGRLLQQPWLVVVPAGLLILAYMMNYWFLRSRLYPEEVMLKKEKKIDSLSDIRYLKALGITGQLISLDLRLIWRHKRTRSMVFMAPLFLGYGLFFYTIPVYRETYSFLIFVGIFMTGGMMLNYLNYCFGYESNYFDNILANYKDYDRYIRTKFIFALVIASACYVLTIPYIFFGTDIFILNTMTFLYNIGFLSYLLLFISTYSTKRMDLSKGAAFNYQGLGATHWLSMLPAFLLPVFIYLPFSWAGYPRAGMLFIGALGVAGLLFSRPLLSIIIRQFKKRRYAMAEGFRQ
jgi:hypothetical protein